MICSMRNICRALALTAMLAVLCTAQQTAPKTSTPAAKSAATAPASPEARKKAAMQLIHLLMPKAHTDQMMNNIGTQFMYAAANDYKRRGLTIPPDFETKMKSALTGLVSYEELTNWGAEVYAQHFTLGELQKMIAFYTSPTGHKLLQDQQEITQQSMRQVLTAVDHRLPPAMKREGLEPPVPRSQQGAQPPAGQPIPGGQAPAPQNPAPENPATPPK